MSKNSSGFIHILLIFLAVIAIGAVLFLGKDKLKSIVSVGTPVPSATVDPTAGWRVFSFSQTISMKLPTNSGIAHTNAGHYAQIAILPNNTTFLIQGADGDSSTGGKDYYNVMNQTITESQLFQIKPVQIDNKVGIEFTTDQPVSPQMFYLGGDINLKLKGVLIKMNDGRGLLVIHYQGKTLQQNGDFEKDGIVFDQILSTFKFTN
jgi:hypothetical protein